jgi:hypothetical protein
MRIYLAIAQNLGSARVSRVGFGVTPKQAFIGRAHPMCCEAQRKVREGEDAFASTRDARATQN